MLTLCVLPAGWVLVALVVFASSSAICARKASS